MTCNDLVADLDFDVDYLTRQRSDNGLARNRLLCGCCLFCFGFGFRSLFGCFRLVCRLLYAREVRFGNEREEFEQQSLFLVLGQQYATCLVESRIRLLLIFRDVVVGLFAYTANLQTEFRIDLDRSFAVFALDQIDELVVLGGVHRTTRLLVECAVYCLCADNLRCRRYERW